MIFSAAILPGTVIPVECGCSNGYALAPAPSDEFVTCSKCNGKGYVWAKVHSRYTIDVEADPREVREALYA